MYKTIATSTVIHRANHSIAVELTPKEYEDLKIYCEVCDLLLQRIKCFRYSVVNPMFNKEPKVINDKDYKAIKLTNQIIDDNALWNNLKYVMVGEFDERTRES